MSLYWIDEYVDGVIDYCYSTDIFEIYNALSINIKRIDKDDSLLQGNEALYVRNYFGIELVLIRDDLPYKFEKFVLSHELGHALLHTEISQAAYDSKLINKGKLEKQADYFALKLLSIQIDDVYCLDLTKDQISRDLCITEESLSYI